MENDSGLALVRDDGGLALTDGTMIVRGDFAHMKPRLKESALSRELLVRAAKVKGAGETLEAIDATAGLGEDAFLLAAAGFDVTLYERNETIAALLEDAIERALVDADLKPAATRLHLVIGDSVEALDALDHAPSIVFLDPMFPERHKSAAVKKKLQLLQQLEHPCEDEPTLLTAALSTHPKKVIVKRPLKAPNLANRSPAYSLKGKAIRYDVYIP